MTEKQKAAYVAPSIEVIEMENEGIIASSLNGFGNGNNLGTPPNPSSKARSYGSASSNDLEDMINDILTIEN